MSNFVDLFVAFIVFYAFKYFSQLNIFLRI